MNLKTNIFISSYILFTPSYILFNSSYILSNVLLSLSELNYHKYGKNVLEKKTVELEVPKTEPKQVLNVQHSALLHP